MDEQRKSQVGRWPVAPETLFDLYVVQGMSAPKVAERFGVPAATVYGELRRLQIPRRPRGAAQIPVDVDRLHARGPDGYDASGPKWLTEYLQDVDAWLSDPSPPNTDATTQDPDEETRGGFVDCPHCGAPRPEPADGPCPWCGTDPMSQPATIERICAACGRSEPHLLTTVRVCVSCMSKSGRHGRFSARRRECACPNCVDLEADNRAMIQERLNGDGLKTIGNRRGLTKERVRQVLRQLAGEDPYAAVRRSLSVEKREITVVTEQIIDELESQPCRACGTVVPSSSGRRSVHCSALCADVAPLLRYHVDEHLRSWRRDYARRRSDRPESATPGHRHGARSMHPGSVVWHAAKIAVTHQWQIADALPDEIVERDIRPYLHPPAPTGDGRPSALGGSPRQRAQMRQLSRLIEAGVSVTDAAGEVGMSASRAYEALRLYYGTETYRRLVGRSGWVAAAGDASTLIDPFEAGQDVMTIADQVGLSTATVRVVIASVLGVDRYRHVSGDQPAGV